MSTYDPDEPVGCARTHRKGSARKRYCGGKERNGEHAYRLLPDGEGVGYRMRRWEDLPMSTQEAYGSPENWAEDVRRRDEERRADPRRMRWSYRIIQCVKCLRKEFIPEAKAGDYKEAE